jgi:membrane associated rhomboid family serine protease
VRLSGGKQSGLTRPWTESRRAVLLALLAINIVAFVTQLSVEATQPGFIRDYLALSNRGVHDAYSWQFVTSMLLYGSPWHFLGNLLILFVLGRDIESILGQRHFLYLFLTGAIGGEFGHLFLLPSDTLLYGASGGVAAVLIAYAIILPELDLIAWHNRFLPLHINARHLAYSVAFLSLVMLMIDRHGALVHSAIPGGLAGGWIYTRSLGFGHPSWLQLKLWRRRVQAERIDRMTPAEFIEYEVNPLLEKISLNGMSSLTRAERRILDRAREKVG